MPDPANTDPTQQTPPEQQPPNPPSSAPPPGPFRISDTAPDYLKGKTEQEVIDWTTRLVTEVQQIVQQTAAPQPTRTQMQQQQIQLPNADEALTDPQGYQAKLAAYIGSQTQAQIAAVAAPVAQQLADTARTLSRNEPKNKEIWEKYGADVDAAVAGIPAHARTQAVYDEAVTLIKGRRFDELASSKAAALAAANPGIERSGQPASDDDGGRSDIWEKIEATPIGRATLDAIGKRGILRNVGPESNKPYKTLEAYVEALSKNKSSAGGRQGQVIRG